MSVKTYDVSSRKRAAFNIQADQLQQLKDEEKEAQAKRIALETKLVEEYCGEHDKEDTYRIRSLDRMIEVKFTVERKADPADFSSLPEEIRGLLFKPKLEYSKSGQNAAVAMLTSMAATSDIAKRQRDKLLKLIEKKVRLIEKKPYVTVNLVVGEKA